MSGSRRHGRRDVALGAASVVAVLALLQTAGLTGLLSEDSFPLVSDVLARLGTELRHADLWIAVGHTLGQAMVGLVAGTLVAVPLGLFLGRIPLAERSIRPVIEFLRPIPSVAVLPVVILTVGVRFQAAAILAGISTLWLVLILTLAGAKAVDPVAQETLVAFRLPRRARIRALLIPSALPFVLTGVRVAASVSLIVAVSAELLGGMSGIGHEMTVSLQNADKTGMYALTLVAGALGLAVSTAFKPLEDALLSWHPSRRGAAS